jgi:hypothetical protein
MAIARVVNTTATRATKKARGSRATRVRATRVITETSPREEGDNGHNNQLGTKAVAMARTVVAMTSRAITTAAMAMATEEKMATASAVMLAMMAMMMTMATMATMERMATMVTMMPNGVDDYDNQAATTARVTLTVARATVTGSKKGDGNDGDNGDYSMTAMMATMATKATMTPNSNDTASGDEGNKDTKR